MRMKCTNSYITWIKRAAAAAMAAVLMLSATACAEEDALSAVASVPVAKELEMNEEAVASGTVTEDKGVLTFAMKKPVDSFFPLGEMDEDLSNVFSMIFEPAVRVSAAAKFEPSVVESWETSSDGTTYTFKVRDGVAFHGDNGTVTAADLAYALNWILGGRVTIETLSGDDTTESEPAEKDVQGQAYEGEEEAGVGVAGMAQESEDSGNTQKGETETTAAPEATSEKSPYAKYGDKVSGITVKGDDTLIIRTSEPTIDVFYLMSFPVVPKSYYEGKESETRRVPVGTNAYYVADYTDEGGFTLALMAGWWRGNPVYSGVNVKPVENEEAKISDYQLGLYDGAATDLLTVNSYSTNANTSVHSVVTPDFNCLVPNMRNEFLSQTEIRRAISLALDRSQIITNSVLGEGLESETAIRPDLWYFDKSTTLVNAYNTTEAKAILDDLGFQTDEETGMRYFDEEDGTRKWLEFNIVYTESKELYYRRSILDTVQQQLKEVGIAVNIVEKTSDEYIGLLENKTFDMALCNFYMKSNNDVSFLFDNYNFGEYSGERLSGLIQATRSAVTDDAMESAYVALQEYLTENLPQIGLFFREHALIMKNSVHLSDALKLNSVYADIGMWMGE
jgi:ABC-type transport system substrate-binding protein